MDCQVCKSAPAKWKWWKSKNATAPQLVCSPLCVYLQHVAGTRDQSEAELELPERKLRSHMKDAQMEDQKERDRLVDVIDFMLERVNQFLANPSNNLDEQKYRLLLVQNIGADPTDPTTFWSDLRDELVRLRINVVSGGARDLSSIRGRLSNELNRILAWENRIDSTGFLTWLPPELRGVIAKQVTSIEKVFAVSGNYDAVPRNALSWTAGGGVRFTESGYVFGTGQWNYVTPSFFTVDNKMFRRTFVSREYGAVVMWKHPDLSGPKIKLNVDPLLFVTGDSLGNSFAVNRYRTDSGYFPYEAMLSSAHGECRLSIAIEQPEMIVQFEEYEPGNLVLAMLEAGPVKVLKVFYFSLETLRGRNSLEARYRVRVPSRLCQVLKGVVWSVTSDQGKSTVAVQSLESGQEAATWEHRWLDPKILQEKLSADHKNGLMHLAKISRVLPEVVSLRMAS